MIEVRNLTKYYGPHKAVDNLSFTVERGQIYGFLGPNGAGKSTTMNILTGCLAATEGTVLIDGHDILEDQIAAKKCIGYLPEIPPLYPDMTPREYLMFVGEAKGLSGAELRQAVEYVCKRTSIEDVANRLIRHLSKGYKQRVGIAQAILGNPEIIILDEPSVGLDPTQIIEIRDLIKDLAKDRTVILSTHIMQEVTAICNHVLIINKGKLLANDTPENLSDILMDRVSFDLVARGDSVKIINAVQAVKGVGSASILDTDGDAVHVLVDCAKDADPEEDIFYALSDARCPIIKIERQEMTLEQVFIRITSQNIDTTETDSDSHEEEN